VLTGTGFSYSAFRIPIGVPRAISLGRALFGAPNPVFITSAMLVVMRTVLNKTISGNGCRRWAATF